MSGRIVRNAVTWRLYQGALIPDSAPHVPITLSSGDIDALLNDSGAYFLRWVEGFDGGKETPFWYVIKDNAPSMEELSANTRSKVRRGLKNCTVERTSAAFIAEHGYDVYRKAFDKYDTFARPADKAAFQSQIEALAGDPAWEFWGVWESGGRLIAYSQNRLENESCNYSTIKFDPEFLKLYPSYALFYTMNAYYLGDGGVRYVNDGARSISHQTNIQDFLIETFKFRKAYCALRIAYAPKISLLIRMLYPLRRLFSLSDASLFRKIRVLLLQEAIRRGCE